MKEVKFSHIIKEPYEIRKICNKYNWYTRGTSGAYNNMMQKFCYKKATPTRIFNMANDIACHSVFTDINNIILILYRDCVNHIAEVEK